VQANAAVDVVVDDVVDVGATAGAEHVKLAAFTIVHGADEQVGANAGAGPDVAGIGAGGTHVPPDNVYDDGQLSTEMGVLERHDEPERDAPAGQHRPLEDDGELNAGELEETCARGIGDWAAAGEAVMAAIPANRPAAKTALSGRSRLISNEVVPRSVEKKARDLRSSPLIAMSPRRQKPNGTRGYG
jgi:hypothetical protein